MSGSCTHSPYSQINRLATFKGFHLDSWYRSIVLSSPSSEKNLNVAHVLRLSRPHNAMCGWPLCIQTNLPRLLFTILNWFSDCCTCSALPPTHVFYGCPSHGYTTVLFSAFTYILSYLDMFRIYTNSEIWSGRLVTLQHLVLFRDTLIYFSYYRIIK